MNKDMSNTGRITNYSHEQWKSLFKSTIFVPHANVEHVRRTSKHPTMERLAHANKHMLSHRTNLPEKSKQSFQNRKWMAQRNKNLIHTNQNKALHEVKFIIAKGLHKITNQCLANQPTKSATTNTQRSRHQHTIGIVACGMGSVGLTHA